MASMKILDIQRQLFLFERGDMAKIRVYKIIPGEDCNPCHEKNMSAVLAWLTSSSPEEKITIEILGMEEAEYDRMPEYMGP